MMTCEEVRLSLGAHAFGALEPDEAVLVEAHLAECVACAAEFDELSAVSGLLGRVGHVSESDVAQVVSPPVVVLDRLLKVSAARRRRSRLLLALAASVVLLAGGGAAWGVLSGSGGEDASIAAEQYAASSPAPVVSGDGPASGAAEDSAVLGKESAKPETGPGAEGAEEPSVTAQVPAASSPPQTARDGGDVRVLESASPRESVMKAAPDVVMSGVEGKVTATVRAAARATGADLTVTVSGADLGAVYRLDVVGADGTREKAGTLEVASAADAVFRATTTMPLTTVVRFELQGDGDVVIRIPVKSR